MSSRRVRDHVKKRDRTEKQRWEEEQKRKEGVGRTNRIVQWVRILATKDWQPGSDPGILEVEEKNWPPHADLHRWAMTSVCMRALTITKCGGCFWSRQDLRNDTHGVLSLHSRWKNVRLERIWARWCYYLHVKNALEMLQPLFGALSLCGTERWQQDYRIVTCRAQKKRRFKTEPRGIELGVSWFWKPKEKKVLASWKVPATVEQSQVSAMYGRQKCFQGSFRLWVRGADQGEGTKNVPRGPSHLLQFVDHLDLSW